jgi:hypothetical protein
VPAAWLDDYRVTSAASDPLASDWLAIFLATASANWDVVTFARGKAFCA